LAPKFHVYVAPAAAVPVKVTVELALAQTGEGLIVNVAVGAALIVIVFDVVELQVPDVTVKEMVLLPFDDHATECGPVVAAVAGVAPAPKFQA